MARKIYLLRVFFLLALCVGLGLPSSLYQARAEDGGAAEPAQLSIMEIQGTGRTSPHVDRLVQTSGVVTALSANGRGFWMQDSVGDDDPATSDAIFVSIGRDDLHAAARPREGDLVRVRGLVEELQFNHQQPLTRIKDVEAIELISAKNPLPPPVDVTVLPDKKVAEAVAFWQALESMRVRISSAAVVGPTNRFGEFVIVTDANAALGSGFDTNSRRIFVHSRGNERVDYNPERIMVSRRTRDSSVVLTAGDRVTDLVGVVDYTFGNYKIQPTSMTTHKKTKPVLPRKIPHDPAKLSIVTMNAENLFDLEINPDKDDKDSTPTPAELETKLAKLSMMIERELGLPDIMVVQEIENQAILQVLGDRVNQMPGAGAVYRAISYDTSDRRGIEVGFLFNERRVRHIRSHLMSGDDVAAAFGPNSDSPGREPIVGVFEKGGRQFTIIGCHFKSKYGDEPIFGVNQPFNRPSEVLRTAQSRVVRDYVTGLLKDDPRAWIIVAGDLNDLDFAEPGEGDNYPVAILRGDESVGRLHHLLERVPASSRYTYIYQGNAQILDYLLASDAAAEQVEAIEIIHINADFPEAMERNRSIPNRNSDHDPIWMLISIPK